VKSCDLTIDSRSAALVRSHVAKTDPALWCRLVAISRLNSHNRKVARANRKADIRRWSADCARLCADIKAAKERGEISIDGGLLDNASDFFEEQAK
jgi:hypothetical protein